MPTIEYILSRMATVESPDDILRYIATAVNEQQGAVVPGVPVDLKPLVDQTGSDAAKELATRMIDNCQHLGWIEFARMGNPPPSSLTDIGMERWQEISDNAPPAPLVSAAVVTNQSFAEPFVVVTAGTVPSQGLYQETFALWEVDFIRLRQTSPVFNTMAATVFAFAFADLLQRVVEALREQSTLSATDFWILGILIATGIGLWVGGRFASRDRRAIMKKIEKHFKDNPAQPDYRIK